VILGWDGDGDREIYTGMEWGIFCGDGMGMGNISQGRDRDGENFYGDGDNFIYHITL